MHACLKRTSLPSAIACVSEQGDMYLSHLWFWLLANISIWGGPLGDCSISHWNACDDKAYTELTIWPTRGARSARTFNYSAMCLGIMFIWRSWANFNPLIDHLRRAGDRMPLAFPGTKEFPFLNIVVFLRNRYCNSCTARNYNRMMWRLGLFNAQFQIDLQNATQQPLSIGTLEDYLLWGRHRNAWAV